MRIHKKGYSWKERSEEKVGERGGGKGKGEIISEDRWEEKMNRKHIEIEVTGEDYQMVSS